MKHRRAAWLAIPLLAMTACSAGASAAQDSSTPAATVSSKAPTEDEMWIELAHKCDPATKAPTHHRGPNGEVDGEWTLLMFKVIECGYSISALDDGGWKFSLTAGMFDHTGASAFMRVIKWMGDETGCFGDTEIAMMKETRPLDGRVEHGKVSWTYHPDDGLDIICEA